MPLNLLLQYCQTPELIELFNKYQEMYMKDVRIEQLSKLYLKMDKLLEGYDTLEKKYQIGFQRVGLLQEKIANYDQIDSNEKMYVEQFLGKYSDERNILDEKDEFNEARNSANNIEKLILSEIKKKSNS